MVTRHAAPVEAFGGAFRGAADSLTMSSA